MPSARKVAADALRSFAEEVRGGSYFVKRGAINWAAFDFSKHSRAIAIMFDDMQFLRSDGMNTARVSMEIFARMPAHEQDPQIDDGLLDELIEDAEYVVLKLISARDDKGDNVVYRVRPDTGTIIEAHDAEKEVQGIIVTIDMTY